MPAPAATTLARACQLIDRAKYEDAAGLLRRHVQKHPSDGAAVGALCHALCNLGQAEQAVYYARALKAASPMLPGAYATLGEALDKARKPQEAIVVLQEGLSLFPQDAQVAFVLAETLRANARHAEAIEICERAVAEGWATDALRSVRATSMHKLGRLDEAMKFVREAQWLSPGKIIPAELACVTANYDPDSTAEQVTALHKRYANILNDHLGSGMFKFPATDDPQRPLRIGILSPDLRRHSVGFFAMPLLRALRGFADVTAYYSGPTNNPTTARFRELCNGWTVVTGMNMAALATLIHADRIDVLIELSGLTLGQAMPVMQVRPAPVQVTYIGYPATTGLSSIDYRIVDSLTDPPGSDSLSAERLVRLDPCFLCYEPWEDPPPVAPLPSLQGLPFTFGSFNNSMKINDRTLRLWARVLEAVPGSRLFLKLLETENEATRRFMLDRLASQGIPEHRLIWKTWEKEPYKHLSSYDQMDVGLDPYPYCGTTTTCESLQMGVPVLTLVGDRHASRVGKSLMEAVGLPQFCVTSEDAYVNAAARFASDLPALAAVREGLRSRWNASPLRDQAGYTARLQAAIRGMWRERCGAPGALG